MQDNLLTGLKDRGMSEKEAKVYLTVLELGSAPASTIGRRAGIKRVTTYSTLQDMKAAGIATTVEREGVLHFQVLDPSALLQILQDKTQKFSATIPELHALADQFNNKPRIKYYDGLKEVKDMYNDLLLSDSEICSFFGFAEMDPKLEDYLYNDFLPRRIHNQVFSRVILEHNELNAKYVGMDKEALKQSITINHEIFDLANDINLYGPDKVMISLFTSSEMLGIVIHSPRLYKSLKSIFELLWLTYS